MVRHPGLKPRTSAGIWRPSMLRNKQDPEAPQHAELGKRKKYRTEDRALGRRTASRQTDGVQEKEKEPWRGRKRPGL